MIGRQETIDLFPAVDRKGLKGGACWYDAFMPDPQLLQLSLLKQACDLGITALNYCKVTKLLRDENRVNGVTATDQTDSTEFKFSAPIVVNAAGPWVRELSGILDAEFADLFKYSVAWNVLFNRDAFSDHALALTPRRFGAQTYFAHRWNGKLLIGTGHAIRSELSEDAQPTEEELETFISDINSAVPSANFSINDIDHVYAGFLPVTKEGKTNLLRTGQIFDHARCGGPSGLYSITGVKYSAAHGLAEDLIDRLFPGLKKLSVTDLVFSDSKDHRFRGEAFKQDPVAEIRKHAEYLRSLIRSEAVIHLDDLVLRRTNIGDDPATALRVAPHVADIFGWDAQQKSAEIQRLHKHYRFHASV
jgi:glycerol-3-phosphate dehydrogenase